MIEERLTETLRQADGYLPSPDLFGRVRRSIDEDLAHRRRTRRVLASVALAVAGGVGALALFVSVDGSGGLVVRRWVIELWESAVLVGLTVALGPAIRRFGRTYAAGVFRLEKASGWRFLRLLDIAYYLVFAGIILVGVDGSSALGAQVELSSALEGTATRIAFLLAVMGGLHALTLLVLPAVGLIFSSSVRRALRAEAGADAPALSAAAEQADRVARSIVWIAAAGVIVVLLVAVGLAVGVNIG